MSQSSGKYYVTSYLCDSSSDLNEDEQGAKLFVCYTQRCTQMSGKDLCATKGVHCTLCNQSHCIVQCSSNSCGSGGVECDGGWRNWRGVAGSEKWWPGRGGWCCNTCAVRKLHHLFGRYSLEATRSHPDILAMIRVKGDDDGGGDVE